MMDVKAQNNAFGNSSSLLKRQRGGRRRGKLVVGRRHWILMVGGQEFDL
jgi:hypothetical protein